MVEFDLAEPKIRVRGTLLDDKRARLIIDYPRDDHFRRIILDACANLLRPNTQSTTPPSSANRRLLQSTNETAGGPK